MLVKVKLSKKSSYGAEGEELMVTERAAQIMFKGEFIEPFQPEEKKEEKAPVETKEEKAVIETKEKKMVRITKSPRF